MCTDVLIVGAGQAAVQIAVTLRHQGFDGGITIVGDEPHAPYQRPPLSKAYLTGLTDAGALDLRSDEFYQRSAIRVISGERVISLGLDSNSRGRASTDSGRALSFGHLALATGARTRRLPVPGSELPGVCYLRDLDDADLLRRRLPESRSVVVIGGGFVGLEAAAIASALGKRVTLVEAAERLVPRVASRLTADYLREAHTRAGVEVLLDSQVTELVSATGGEIGHVRLADGREIVADLVVTGVGAEPNIDPAVQLGLDVDGGVVVDDFCRTSNPRVVAAGDCTVHAGPAGLRRLESVQNAVAQGRIAARTIMGIHEVGDEVPWFWSDQGDLKLQIAGVPSEDHQTVLRGAPSEGRFSIVHLDSGGRLCAVESINRPQDHLQARRVIGQGTRVDLEAVTNPELSLLKTVIPN